MKKCFIRYAALCGMVASLLFLGMEARAQRTVRGQSFISADFAATFSPVLSRGAKGAEVWYGQYLDVMFWQAGLQYMPGYVKDSEHSAPGCFTLSGGAMYRLFGTRSRIFNGYVGGHALFGAEFKDGQKAIADLIVDDSGHISTEETEDPGYKTAIVYGVEPRFEVEFFPLKSVALVGGVSVPVKIQTQKDVVSARGYVGVRINF